MKSKLPFRKEDYFRILDEKLQQPIVNPQGGTVIDRLLQVAQTVKYTTPTPSRN